MNKDENYIDFDSIRNSITFDNINFFSLYLNDIFIHLTNRLSAPSHYLSKPIFHEYFGIRHFIAEKLYNAMNQSQTPSLSKADFTSKMISLYQGDFDETIKIIYVFYRNATFFSLYSNYNTSINRVNFWCSRLLCDSNHKFNFVFNLYGIISYFYCNCLLHEEKSLEFCL